MKVIIVVGNRSIGGAQRVAMHLYEWLNRKNDSSAMIVSLTSYNGKTYDMSGLHFIELKQGRSKINQLRSIINSEKPDILLSMGIPMTIYTVPACIGTGVKHIISERNDPGHFHGKYYIKHLSRFLMRFGDGFVFQTNEAQEFYKHINKEKSIVIPNPLSNMEKMPSNKFDGKRSKTIVSVGRLVDQKNHILLINAFSQIVRKHPDYKLIIWGEGPNRNRLIEYCNQKNIANCILLPGATDDLFNEIYSAGMFVLSSDFEGMPNALMEAMALGLPCISTDCPCGGPRELICDDNGLLVPVGNEQELVKSIEFFISNPDKTEQYGMNAFRIRDKYSCDAICNKWYAFFQMFCNK